MKAFCTEQADEVSFYLWLQWLAYCQFAECWHTSQHDAMPIGLYRDLAVGVAEGGSETRVRPRAVLSESLRRGAAGHSWPAGAKLGSAADGSAYHRRPCL